MQLARIGLGKLADLLKAGYLDARLADRVLDDTIKDRLEPLLSSRSDPRM